MGYASFSGERRYGALIWHCYQEMRAKENSAIFSAATPKFAPELLEDIMQATLLCKYHIPEEEAAGLIRS